MRKLTLSLLCFSALVAAPGAYAASLQIAPVLLDVTTAGNAATAITLHNSGTKVINAQVRVYKWSQVDGEDVFDETNDVAVAPPIMSLKPNADFTVRVVRKSGAPVKGEESYRVIADELPDLDNQAGGTINLIVRHSVPLFFRSPDASKAVISWSVSKSGGKLDTQATNAGERRMRVTALKVTDGSGGNYSYGNGLVGYVLGNSSAVFTSKTAVRGFGAGKAQISAQGDIGPVNATAPITAGQ